METDRPGRGEALAVAGVAAAILALGAWLVTGPETRLAFLLYDDAYYYFGVARSLASGLGSTFDGLNASNGYHPLWCWILVPLAALARDPDFAVRVFAGVWFLLAAAAPVALWWAIRPRTGGAGAVVAAAAFGLQPAVAIGLARPNGLETPLLALVLALAAGVWERRRGSIGFGAILGALVLARLDAGAFALASAGLGRKVRDVALVAAVAFAIAGPSLVWNVAKFGSPLPVSGRVVSLEAAAERASLGGAASIDFVKRRARYALVDIPHRLAGGWTGVLVAIVVVPVGIALRRRRGSLRSDALFWLVAGGAIHYAAYALWLWTPGEARYRLYYFMPECMAVAGALGATVGPAIERWVRAPALRVAGATVLVAVLAWRTGAEARHEGKYRQEGEGRVSSGFVYGWIRSTLPEDAVVGARDAGKLGWFCGRRVVNLDGLINSTEYFEAMRDGRVDAWIADSPIDVVLVDGAWLGGWDPARPLDPPKDAGGFGGTLWKLAGREGVKLSAIPGAPDGWVAVRIERGAGTDGS